MGQGSRSHPLADALVTLAGLSRGGWPEECPLPRALLAAADDTSQCFQEILKIPALHKTRRAEDPREEEMGRFLSARAEQRRERSPVLAGCSHGGGICGDIAITHSIQARPGKGGNVATEQGRTQAWISHCSLSRTIASSPAEGVVQMSPIQGILGMITHLPHFLKSLRAVCYSPHPCCPPLLWGAASAFCGQWDAQGASICREMEQLRTKMGISAASTSWPRGPWLCPCLTVHLRLLPGSFGVLWGFHGNAECCGAVPELCCNTWAPGFILENYLYQHLY